jgi:hypothetical protein
MKGLVRRHFGAFLALTFAIGWAPAVQASIIVTAVQTGGDVILTSNGGSLDLFGSNNFGGASTSAVIWPGSPDVVIGPSSATSVNVYIGSITEPGGFGTGSEIFASSGTGALFGVVDQILWLYLRVTLRAV